MKKNGTGALSHPAMTWSQTCDLAPLLCWAGATSLGKALQPGSPPFWENSKRISLNGRAQNGLRQLSISLSLLEMHRDMTKFLDSITLPDHGLSKEPATTFSIQKICMDLLSAHNKAAWSSRKIRRCFQMLLTWTLCLYRRETYTNPSNNFSISLSWQKITRQIKQQT